MTTHTCCAAGVCSYDRHQKRFSAPKAGSLHSNKLNECRRQLTASEISRAGRLQSQATAIRPVKTNDRVPGSPDISMLSPKLQQQWDVEGNMHLGSVIVKPYSGIRAVWWCNKCPAGQPHFWTLRVQDRIRNSTKCPYCSNRAVCLHNSLATLAPDVAQYWNHSKNHKTPEQALAGSNLKAEWKCPACNWEWQAPIAQRTRTRAGCPKCSASKRSQQSQPTFAEAQHACLAEWDYEHNNANNIFPDNITLGSNKRVHWICSCCPGG